MGCEGADMLSRFLTGAGEEGLALTWVGGGEQDNLKK